MRPTILVLALLSTASPSVAQIPASQTGTAPTAAQPNQPTTPRPAEQTPATTPATPSTGPTPAGVSTAPIALPTTPVTPAVRTSTTGAAAECPMCADSVNAYWVAFWVITGFLIVALLGTLISLKNSNWSLADALAEKSTELKRVETVHAVQGQPASTIETPVLVGSASRLIATIGTLVLTAIMLGVGYSMIWSLFTRGQIPALDGIGPYLMGGAALFAPYAFNQLKEAFKPAPTR